MEIAIVTSEIADVPERTCAGCRQKDEPSALLRFATSTMAPFVAPDPLHKLGGRGVSVHPTPRCLRDAAKSGFARSLKRPVAIDADALIGMVRQTYQRRVEGLLLAASRSRALALGTEAVREAMFRDKVRGIVVASDAAGRREELISAAERLGSGAVVFSTKEALGHLFGRGELGVIGILEDRIAMQVVESGQRALALSEAE